MDLSLPWEAYSGLAYKHMLKEYKTDYGITVKESS